MINPLLINVAIQELPDAIQFIREAFTQQHPTEPAPTDEEVIAAYNVAFQSSVDKDDAWLRAHPTD